LHERRKANARDVEMTREERDNSRSLALGLAGKHPGWGCRRISDAMRKRHGVYVCKTTVAE
jgi:hypothetical protein